MKKSDDGADRMCRAPAVVKDFFASTDFAHARFRLENGTGRGLSAAEVRRAATALVARLEAAAGPGDGQAVIIQTNEYGECALAVLAAWAWGGVPVPIPGTAPASFVAQVVAECEPAVTVTVTKDGASVRLARAPARCRACARPAHRAGSRAAESPASKAAQDVSLILYSSGSTGSPKGILIPPDAIDFATSSIQRYLGLTEWDRIVNPIVPHFDYGLYQLLLALNADCTLIPVPALFVDDVFEVIRRRQGTVLPLVPSLAASLTTRMLERGAAEESVRLITSTGSHLGAQIITRLRGRFPRAHVVPMYGLTECKRVTYLAPNLVDLKPGSVGRPMRGVGCRILDRAGRPVPEGEVGELVVTGGNLALGYLGDHPLTEAVFRRTPGGGRELWTGDLFVRDADGFLYHRGRRDDLVKVSDQRLSLREVEDALRSVAGVVDALAWVDDGTLRADVVAEPTVADAASVRRSLRPSVRLPAMVPAEITLVSHLRTGTTGKPARPKPAVHPQPDAGPHPQLRAETR